MFRDIYYDRKTNAMHLWDDAKGYHSFPYQKYAYAKAQSGKLYSLDGFPVRKVYNWSYDDEKNGVLYEADITPDLRVLVDTYYESDDVSTGHF